MRVFKYKVLPNQKWLGINETLRSIKEDINSATEFVRQIEKGNLNASITGSEETSELVQSLTRMRDQFKTFTEENEQRNWINEGLGKFVEILRSKNDTLESLSNQILSQLLKYIKANQGALYIVNDDDPEDVYIEMLACYAFDRKKHINQRIELGDGLTGQAVLEKDTIYLKDIPKSFVHITSGLGESTPRNVLIVPLKIDDRVFGVLEIASFQLLKAYEIEFIEKIGESIAATISSAKAGERTSRLLQETQQQAEEMKSQEEEMRQNMEELTATQEEMRRILKEMEDKEAYVTSLLNVTSDAILTMDRDFRLVTWNKAMAKTLDAFGIHFEKGSDSLAWYPDGQREQQQNNYERALAGESFELTSSSVQNGSPKHLLTAYAPLRNEKGEVYEIAIFTKDVTSMIEAQQKAETLRIKAEEQANELRQQEEELRQNMEEINAQRDGMQQQLQQISELKRDLEERELVFGATTILSEADVYGTIIFVNSKFCEVSKYKEEELIGKPHNIVRHPDMSKEVFRLMWNTIKKGEIFRGIVKNRTKDGGHYWVDACIVPIKGEDGKIKKYIGARYHITNEEIALDLYNKQMEQLLAKV